MRLPIPLERVRAVEDHHVDRRDVQAQQCVQRTRTNCSRSCFRTNLSCYGVLRVGVEFSSAQEPHTLGGHSGGETPLPIPNREVKPASADGTRRAISRESRTPPIFFAHRLRGRGLSSWERAQAARSLSRHSGSSSRNRRTRSPTGGCVVKSAANPSSANGFVT